MSKERSARSGARGTDIPRVTRRGFLNSAATLAGGAALASSVYDHTSVLKLIEKRWSLPPLAVRDASAISLGTALDFEQNPRTAPEYQVAPIVSGAVCPANGILPPPPTPARVATAEEEDEWGPLYDLARRTGWNV